MADLRTFAVDDPDGRLPDPNRYTPLLEYRTPATLPADGRFVADRHDVATVNGWFPLHAPRAAMNRFAIVSPPPPLPPTPLTTTTTTTSTTTSSSCSTGSTSGGAASVSPSAPTTTWQCTDRTLFYDVLAHPNIVSRERRDSFFEWLCEMTRYRDYMFVVVHRLYTTRVADGGNCDDVVAAADANDANSGGRDGDDDDDDDNNSDDVGAADALDCEAPGKSNVADADGVVAVVARAWLRRRAERRRRRYDATRPRVTLRRPRDAADAAARSCGSLVVLYANDMRYAETMCRGTSEDIYVATAAFQSWNAQIHRGVSYMYGAAEFPLLPEPPDVFTEAPLAQALHARHDVRFRLRLYDFQSRTVNWMRSIENDEGVGGGGHCLRLKHHYAEWLHTWHTNIGYSQSDERLVIGQSNTDYPSGWRYATSVARQALPATVLSEYAPALNAHAWPRHNDSPDLIVGGDAHAHVHTEPPLERVRQLRRSNEVRLRGGIICDATGTGKTVEAIGLVALQAADDVKRVRRADARDYVGIARWRHPPASVDDEGLYYCAATLVVAPRHVCKQWVDQFEKAAGAHAHRVLLVTSARDAQAVSLTDVLRHYDVVVFNKEVAQHQLYRRVRAWWTEALARRLGWIDAAGNGAEDNGGGDGGDDDDDRAASESRVAPRRYELRNDYNEDVNDRFAAAVAALVRKNRRATRAAPDVATPGCFFPAFHAALCKWRRVVIDEVHELDERWRLVERAVCAVRAEARWGLTASPAFGTASTFGSSQGGYLALMRVRRSQRALFLRPSNRWQFVQNFTRRSGFAGMPSIVVRRVDVHMTPQEMAMYQSLDQVGARTLLEFCCHHDLSNDAWLRQFLPPRVYRQQVQGEAIDDGGDDDDDDGGGGGSAHIVPHTVQEVATAMQSARRARIESLRARTRLAERRWRSGEQDVLAILDEFAPHLAAAYRTTCWWLAADRRAPALSTVVTTTTTTTKTTTTAAAAAAHAAADAAHAVAAPTSALSGAHDHDDDDNEVVVDCEERRQRDESHAKNRQRIARMMATFWRRSQRQQQQQQQQQPAEPRRKRARIAPTDDGGEDGIGGNGSDDGPDLSATASSNRSQSVSAVSAAFAAAAAASAAATGTTVRGGTRGTGGAAEALPLAHAANESDDDDDDALSTTSSSSSSSSSPAPSEAQVARGDDVCDVQRVQRVQMARTRFDVAFERQTIAMRSMFGDLDAMRTVERQYRYYESIFELLQHSADIDCPICLGAIPQHETVLTTCGHQFCMDCIDADGDNRVRTERRRLQGEMAHARRVPHEMVIRCATCRAPLRVLSDLKVIDRTVASASERAPSAPTLAVQPKASSVASSVAAAAAATDAAAVAAAPAAARDANVDDYSRYGSKIRCILETIWAIQARRDAKKIVVFAQSHHLLHLIGDALAAFGLPFVYVEGRHAERNIERFRRDALIRVILLSTERRGDRSTIAGLDLPEANYLIAAHPPVGTEERCYQEMKQAIGRIRRIGQTSECHLLVMVTRNTIEETLYERWRSYADRRDRECGDIR